MFAAIVFVLLSVASAQRYPLNQVYGPKAVPVNYNAAAIQNYPQSYAAQPYGKYGRTVGQYNDGVAERDFEIERIGERHSLQSGGNQFQYSFVRGGNVESPVQRYAVPQVEQYGVNSFAKLRAGPVVRKVFGAGNLY